MYWARELEHGRQKMAVIQLQEGGKGRDESGDFFG